MRHPSPLRYPGGKAALTPFLAQTIKANGLPDCIYVEPFAGGAGAALSLLFSEEVSEIHLNDKDRRIYSLWKSILDEPEAFIGLLDRIPVSVGAWRRQRTILRNHRSHSPLEVGFATFYLNRCNHSGVLNGGPIGGLRQDGDYRIDVRFNKAELRRRIEKIVLYRERIKITNMDALVLMRRLGAKEHLLDRYLIYLDPPYFAKAERLYPLYYSEEDHKALAHYIARQKTLRWLISYDDAPTIRKLYQMKKIRLKKKYSLRSARIGRELIISSPTCILPNVNPLNLI